MTYRKTSLEYEQWIGNSGIAFLQSIGMDKKYIVLDFGCRRGTYTIPAAMVVGNDGQVYAADKDRTALDTLMKTAEELDLENIKRVDCSEKISLPFDTATFDMVLLFDVLHLVENRRSLIFQLYNLLKKHGVLILYPHHHEEHLKMTLDEVIKMVEKSGFHFDMKTYSQLMHDDQLIQDWILIFHKC